MQLEVKTILNRIQHFAGFVYQDIRLCCHRGRLRCIEISLEPHRGIGGKCSECRQPAPGYDRLPQRPWLFVPLWGIKTYFLYAPRRVECPEHGVVVEHIPWSQGKRPITLAMMGFLARWARRLSWRETARAFQTSWECVYRSVQWFDTQQSPCWFVLPWAQGGECQQHPPRNQPCLTGASRHLTIDQL